jgi:hypothetical protein
MRASLRRSRWARAVPRSPEDLHDGLQRFLAHPYGVAPEPWSGGLPAGFSTECEIQ